MTYRYFLTCFLSGCRNTTVFFVRLKHDVIVLDKTKLSRSIDLSQETPMREKCLTEPA